MRVAAEASKGGRVNEIDIAGNQFTEGLFGAPLSVIAQQLAGVSHASHIYKATPAGNPTKNLGTFNDASARIAEVDLQEIGEQLLA